MQFKSSQSTTKYHYEKQLKEDTLKRLRMYLLSTAMSGIDRVRLLKKVEGINPCDFEIVWAKLPGNILVQEIRCC